MNSLERTLKTIQLELPDKVPVDLHAFAMTANLSSHSMAEVFQNGRLMAESQIALWEKCRHDMILLENGTTSLAEAMGAKVIYPADSVPKVVEPVLKRLEDVDQLSVPDPGNSAFLPELLKATEFVSRELGKEVFVMGRADQGPFSLAALLRGIDNFMLDLMDHSKQKLLHQLLDTCTKAVTSLALAQLEAGAHGTSMGESLAGPDLISPAMYAEFAFTYEQKVVEKMRRRGGVISLHICGNSTAIIEKMAETGAQILEIDEKVDLETAKAATKGKCCLLGPISPTALRFKTAAEIEVLTKKAIELAAVDGGLILGPGCAMAADTPLRNVQAMIRTARQYGVYNVNL